MSKKKWHTYGVFGIPKSIWLEASDNRFRVFAYLTTLLEGRFSDFAYLTTFLEGRFRVFAYLTTLLQPRNTISAYLTAFLECENSESQDGPTWGSKTNFGLVWGGFGEARWLKMAPRWAKMAHLGARLAHLGAIL